MLNAGGRIEWKDGDGDERMGMLNTVDMVRKCMLSVVRGKCIS